jgi:hypothetical protein
LADAVAIELEVDRDLSPGEGPGGLYRLEDPAALVLELHRCVRHEDTVLEYEMYDWDGPLPHTGEAFFLRHWWQPEAVELARDVTRIWTRALYPQGDDCDFCPLTWKRFSADPRDIGYEREGYRSGGAWVSVEGYERYIRDDRLRMRAGHRR